ncbi:MAG: STAS domain-containing protein [Pseudohongiellaceae bacterium]|nr:STAS domain-containing protein [Pseudohongiellaceae bacterium]
MSIQSYAEDDGRKQIIKIQGRFNFSMHLEFRDAYSNVTGGGTTFVLDFSEVTYLDSAALGMLLLLREHAEKNGGKVEITRVNDDVKRVLIIANFDSLFTIN